MIRIVDTYPQINSLFDDNGFNIEKWEKELESDADEENFVWQLFTEGIAMYFEQVLVGDSHYFHQGGADWVDWCDGHFSQILHDFNNDLCAGSWRTAE